MLLAFPHGITVRGGGMVILLVIRTELGGKAIFLLKRKNKIVIRRNLSGSYANCE